MSGAILSFEGGRHAEAQRLLPWLANGTLEPDDAARVHRHLVACQACQQDLDALRALRAACLDQVAPAHDADAGWRRLQGRLRPGAAAAAATRAATAPRWLRWTLAAQAALLAAFAIALWQRPAPAPYRVLGAPPANGDLVVVFDPALDEARLRALLRASGARIVDGPNDAGAYVLAVPQARIAGVRTALRAAPGVRLVESLAPEPAPAARP